MSKSTLNAFYHTISKALDSKQLSYTSTVDYKRILKKSSVTLDKCGYPLTSIQQLKQRHIKALVTEWVKENLSVGTIKNRLTALRGACKVIGKRGVVQNNDEHGIGSRKYYSG